MRDCSTCKHKPRPGAKWENTPCRGCAPWEPETDREARTVNMAQWLVDCLSESECRESGDTTRRETILAALLVSLITLTAEGKLTRKDLAILRAWLSGLMGTRDVARACKMSEWAVRAHRKKILAALTAAAP